MHITLEIQPVYPLIVYDLKKQDLHINVWLYLAAPGVTFSFCCCNNAPDSILRPHSTCLDAISFFLAQTREDVRNTTHPNKPHRRQPERLLESDDLLDVLKTNCKQAYLASCLPCNKPDPSTVRTAPFRVFLNVLMKNTWAVQSFFMWTLSPPSICRKTDET